MKYRHRFITKIVVVMLLLSTFLGMPGVFADDPITVLYKSHTPSVKYSVELTNYETATLDKSAEPIYHWVGYLPNDDSDVFFLAIRSIEYLDEAEIGSVKSVKYYRHPPEEDIWVDSEGLYPAVPPWLNGPEDAHHLTIFAFYLKDIIDMQIKNGHLYAEYTMYVHKEGQSSLGAYFSAGKFALNLSATFTLEKEWEGNPPNATATFQLYYWNEDMDENIKYGDPVNVQSGYFWDGLPFCDSKGKPYGYFVQEIDRDPIYWSKQTKSDNGVGDFFCKVNNYTSMNITVEKKWHGGPVDKPPVTIHLLQNGTPIDSVTLDGSEADPWVHIWKAPMYDVDNQKDYEYTALEEEVENYEVLYTRDTFIWGHVDLVVENIHSSALREIKIQKIWEGAPADKPPVTINLLQNGKTVSSVIFDGSEADPWTHTWQVPEFDNEGEAYIYKAWEKTELDGYEKPEYGPLGGWVLTITNKKIPPTEVEVEIPGKKELKGRELKADEFGFSIYNASDLTKPIQSVKNAKDGTFSFLIEFKEGKYELVIKEDKGNLEHVTYDKTEVEVDVVVTRDANGFLVAEVTPKTDVVFKNTYAPPKLPDTGGGVGIGYLLAGMVLLGGGIVMGRKKKEQ